MFQSGTYNGTYTVGGTTYEVDDWWGQRDHSWGIRDHGRCPLWMWFQVQLPDGFLGVWHWELANGAPRLHRRLLGRRRRQRPGAAGRLPPRRRVGRRRRRRPSTASTARRSPGCAGTATFTLAGRPARSSSRPRAASTGPTSRSTAAGSTRCGCAPTTGATARRSSRSPARATTATSPTPPCRGRCRAEQPAPRSVATVFLHHERKFVRDDRSPATTRPWTDRGDPNGPPVPVR